MIEMNRISIELDAYENAALAHAIRLRVEYLATQPVTLERDTEMHTLISICRKALLQTKVNAEQELPGLN